MTGRQLDHDAVLRHAVESIHGAERPGQLAMADAVAEALHSGRHLLVQAGTGTGKSLGYLAPVLVHLVEHPHERITIATATLALQSQLANNDIPAAIEAVAGVTGKRPTAAILKGRTNYACLLRVRDGSGADQAALIPAAEVTRSVTSTPAATPESALGAEVVALREWAEKEDAANGLADRDKAPSHTDRGWQQVSIPVRECLGVQRCPQGHACFVERSREEARSADLVVTNHALLAINAMHGGTALPPHDALIIDEAHELVARVTGAASAELSPQLVERVARRAMTYLDDEPALELLETVEVLRQALEQSPPARVEDPDSAFAIACARVRAACRTAVTALGQGEDKTDPERRQASAAVAEVLDVATRMAALSPQDVVYVSERERSGREARVSPLSVAGLMRKKVFAEHTTILTSATLKLGGDFDQVAASVGLSSADRRDRPEAPTDPAGRPGETHQVEPEAGDTVPRHPLIWRGLDVGSPFDYPRQAILYLARSLPPPGREGLSETTLAEVAELLWASGGRTLGLFSSRRAAETAAGYVRKQLPKMTVLCQGDAQLSELTRRFVEDEQVSLFGTLSLWQGVDVPGTTCQLVIIDRIPFPRPDEPLTVARQRAVAEGGGNGFMAVAAAQAALLLAQGSGRLIRRLSDRGVVAVLDPRLATAHYGRYLRESMPPMWQTSDREVAVAALRRLDEGRALGDLEPLAVRSRE